ncbi:MAG TPA: uracil-DNA glycosylase family protein [Chitinophagaceae bacterium]|jgi:hypothetical protein|nr:uracil-DNA glycosylase family protein [Chitinophagaceae bacterium]
MKLWSRHIFEYLTSLSPPADVPAGIAWLRPYDHPAVRSILELFLEKYFNDSAYRTLILGINPGRFGAGQTGINFTAPKQLKEYCGIEHPFKDSTELSAEFIYRIINQFGGPEQFYSRFILGSVCPLGLVKNGKNLNYYDDEKLCSQVKPFIVSSISKMAALHINDRCVCIGEKNFRYLSNLNSEFGWFKSIVTVPHPRFIMQYKRKELPAYVQLYLDVLKK